MVKSNEQAAVPAVQKTGGAVAAYDYGQDSGAGYEGVSGKDLSIPFFNVLQSNSQQVEGDDPKGAKAGMFFNTVTRELTDGEAGFVFLPVHTEVLFVEWVPRNKGGGFVGVHAPDSEEVKAAQKLARELEQKKGDGKRINKLPHGENELVETHYVYGLQLDAEGKSTVGFAVIPFTSTKIKPYRDWRSAMYMIKGRPPLFANRARLTTIKQKNKDGTFFNVRIDPLIETWVKSLVNPATEKPLLDEARDFRELVVTGVAKADFAKQQGDEPEEAQTAGDPGKAPF